MAWLKIALRYYDLSLYPLEPLSEALSRAWGDAKSSRLVTWPLCEPNGGICAFLDRPWSGRSTHVSFDHRGQL